MFLRLLGAVGVGEDAESVKGVGGRTPEAVLAHLALADGRVVPVDTLIAGVWDEPIESARNAVQVAVAGLRRRLGPQTIDGGRDGYRLQTSLMRIDLAEAHELATDAQNALVGGRPAAALSSCETAAKLFTGEPLSGLRSVRSASQRERAQELRGSLMTTRARALVDLGRFRPAIDLLREEIIERPFDEVQHEILMRALALDGNPTDALDVYEALRRRLADELGTDPASTTTLVFTEILSGRLAPPPNQARRFEPRVTVPASGSPLIGRETEVREAVTQFERGYRLVCVVGTGGIGKTRLALEVAAQVTAAGGSPSVFVDLAAARDPGEVLGAVTSALDVAAESIVDSLAGTGTLLTLDNAEHVLDAVATLVVDLLAVPSVNILVTSRTPLHLRDESVLDLDGLESDGATSPALQLLAERANLSDEEL
ncbi:MAG: BTAD domain-containing putative transcriptional regulator, partial [Mycetocola sp.]